MDKVLRSHMLACFEAYKRLSNMSEATIAARCAGDWRFFERLADSNRTFTVKKYEDIMRWFAENWPAAFPWPDDVPPSCLQASDQAGSHAA